MKVAVVGAGLSGLVAANRLTERGYQVSVFDRNRNSGGRLHTLTVLWDNNDERIDLGAQYFTCDGPEFKTQVEQWVSSGLVKQWHFTPYKLTANGLTPSPDQRQRFVAVSGMQSVADSLAENLDVQFSTTITKLNKQGKKWQFEDNHNQNWTEFDWVILAMPTSQSNLLVAPYGLAKHTDIYSHHPCWAAALATKGDVNTDIQGIFGDRTVSWVSRNSAKVPQSSMAKCNTNYDDIWVVHFAPHWSAENQHQPKQVVTAIAKNWLRDALEAPELQLIHQHTYFWSSASINSDISNERSDGFVLDLEQRIGLAGDAYHGGRVEGAYLSGLKIANKIVEANC